MNATMRRGTFPGQLVAGVFAAVVPGSTCTANGAPLAGERPAWKAGDRWNYTVTNTRTHAVSSLSRTNTRLRSEGGYVLAEEPGRERKTERITVPAGMFDCLKIVSDRTRMTYDARAMSRPSYSSVAETVAWFCPAIRANARQSETWKNGYGSLVTTETVLVDYRLSE